MNKILSILLLCFVFLAACGPKKVAMKYADSYIEGQVEKRLPLYQAQEENLSKDIDKFLNEHKDKVREIRTMIEKLDLDDASTLDENFQKFSKAYLDVARNFSGVLAQYIARFDEKQKRDFLKKIEKENQEVASLDKKARREKIAARFKKYLGSVSQAQEKLLKEHAKVFDKQVERRARRRADLYVKLKEILSQDTSAETKKENILEAFVNFQEKAITTSENLEIARKFQPTLSKEQKNHLRRELGEINEYLAHYLETTY